jgi:crossover junction endodeoxyribonuclease RuvC
MIVGGIDPGKSGGLAVVNELGDCETTLMPVDEDGLVDGAAILRFFAERDAEIIIIERVSAMPKQGVTSSFNFGHSAGAARASAQCLLLPIRMVEPQVWKRAAGLIKKSKTASRELASTLFPRAAQQFKRAKDDGRAEAALMGAWHLGILQGGE